MKMKKVVDIAHDILKNINIENGIYADFTCGNGYDTCFLASLEKVQKVYAFDIQKEALQQSIQAVSELGYYDKCRFILDGHEHLDQYITEPLAGAIFNFGYLPHGDENVTTLLHTSRIAVQKALKQLQKHGMLILVIYPGHDEGKKESCYFSEWVKTLDSHYYSCMGIRMENKKESPYLLVIEKLRNQ